MNSVLLKIIYFAGIAFFLSISFGNISFAQQVSTFAGNGNGGYSGDGLPARNAELEGISAAAIDDSGNLYFADMNNNVVRKIAVTQGNIISTIAGNGKMGYSGDGGYATAARLHYPAGLAIDHQGNIFIADLYNNCIRKIDVAGTITTVVGSGESGYSGNGGPATKAKLMAPAAIAFDSSGNMYIADCDNNCIRRVSKSGIISLFAGDGFGAATGIGNFWGDGGPAVKAELNHPNSIAISENQDVYVSDCFNQRIRKINNKGIITTVAGTGDAGFNNDTINATEAQINYPNGIAIDSRGYVYLSDHKNHRIRCISKQGIITTIAGTGTSGYSNGENVPAQSTEIDAPSFVLIDQYGNLFFGDKGNNRIRQVSCSPTAGNLSNAILPCIKMHPKSE